MALGGLPMGGASSPPMQQDPVSCSPTFVQEGKLAMTDIFPATLMLATTLAIWAGIAWLLIELIG
jgi:hypothetical protein